MELAKKVHSIEVKAHKLAETTATDLSSLTIGTTSKRKRFWTGLIRF